MMKEVINNMKQTKRYELSGYKRLRIDKADCSAINMTFWNRLKFLFGLKTTIKYVEVFNGIESGWVEE